MLTLRQTCKWEVSEQGNRQFAVCTKCNDNFCAGDLRLRPAGAKKTRLIHPQCSHGIINSVADIANIDDLSVAMRQRLDRALALAPSSHGATGDVPNPDISDPRRAEIMPLRNVPNTLKNLELLDQIHWDSISHCRSSIRHVPDHWVGSITEAKHAVVTAIRARRESVMPDRSVGLQRLWKLLSNIDALLLHRPARYCGGK